MIVFYTLNMYTIIWKKLTEKHIQILKQSNTGRKHTPEELYKMSIIQLVLIFS